MPTYFISDRRRSEVLQRLTAIREKIGVLLSTFTSLPGGKLGRRSIFIVSGSTRLSLLRGIDAIVNDLLDIREIVANLSRLPDEDDLSD